MSIHDLIIGGTKGIGRKTAELFRKKGHLVSIIGRKNTEEISKIQGARYWFSDITKKDVTQDTLKEIIKENGPVDNVIFFQRYRGENDEWEGEIATSLTATKYIIEQLAETFSNDGEKSILIISSVAAELIAEEQGAGYHVAKAGIVQLMRYYAAGLGKKGIRVNCISPAIVLKEESRPFYSENRSLKALYEKITPLGRMGTPEDIANLAEFICSPKASYITGHNFVIDGGLTLQMQASLCVKNLLD